MSYCRQSKFWLALLIIATAAHLSPKTAFGYSVLTHEELIDLAWNECIRPLLLARFPNATDAQLVEAHAYAYGGSAIQDMGYYPFGKQFFSDLTHYVRSGDFIAYLFHDARDLNEYAFAIGALSHYVGDSTGHSQAINPSTAIAFPDLERKYGSSVTYDESPHGHIRTEFAFDIEELAGNEFAPPPYLRAVGFKVPRKALERAFISTYGIDAHEVLGRAHADLRSYRTSVRTFIPAVAEAELVLHRHQFPPPPRDESYRVFAERVSRTNYDRHWRHAFKGPGVRAHLLAIAIFILPKVGPLSDLAIKIPTAETQEWYLGSVNHTVDEYRDLLNRLRTGTDSRLSLANLDLDTGKITKPGTYPLTDKTYAKLLQRLTSNPERTLPDRLKQNVLAYYSDPNAPITTKKNQKAWSRVIAQLQVLKTMKVGKPEEIAADGTEKEEDSATR
jgi:Zinc dependent phospholipase C